MIGNKKMLIMFKKDCDIDCGNRRFIKFLNKEKTCAIFYNTLIAPKYFKEYLEENKIIEVCEIVDDKVLSDNEDKIYTFRENMGVYNVNKGIELERKLVLFIEEGMELNLSLPRYGYKIIDNKIHLTRYKDNKKFCYVVNEE